MSKHPVSKIIDALGPEEISARLDVSEYSIRHAKVSKRFPASWYGELDDMCAAARIECPKSLFNFKSSASSSEAG